MKVKDLIQELSRFNDDAIVFIKLYEDDESCEMSDFTIDSDEIHELRGDSYTEVYLTI